MNDALRRWLEGEKPKPANAPSSARPADRGKRRPSAVVEKLTGFRRFFDSLDDLEPRLTPGAALVWCWLWTASGTADGKGHRVRTSERRLSARLGMSRDTVRKRLGELEAAGFVALVRRGRHGRFCSLYRVRPTPKRPTD